MNEQPCGDTIHLDADNPLVQATFRCDLGAEPHDVHSHHLELPGGTEVVVQWFGPDQAPVALP